MSTYLTPNKIFKWAMTTQKFFALFTIHVMMKKDDNIEGIEQDNVNHKYVTLEPILIYL
jgi:hypothetical protein